MGVARNQKRAAAKAAPAKPAKAEGVAAQIVAQAHANKHRGEAVIHLDGKPHKAVLTMNALAEIEEGLGVPLAKIGDALKEPTLLQLRLMIAALVRGGGDLMITELGDDGFPHTRLPTDQEVGAHKINIQEASVAMVTAFIQAGVFQVGGEPSPGN